MKSRFFGYMHPAARALHIIFDFHFFNISIIVIIAKYLFIYFIQLKGTIHINRFLIVCFWAHSHLHRDSSICAIIIIIIIIILFL